LVLLVADAEVKELLETALPYLLVSGADLANHHNTTTNNKVPRHKQQAGALFFF
jgi:hypothetical protein